MRDITVLLIVTLIFLSHVSILISNYRLICRTGKYSKIASDLDTIQINPFHQYWKLASIKAPVSVTEDRLLEV